MTTEVWTLPALYDKIAERLPWSTLYEWAVLKQIPKWIPVESWYAIQGETEKGNFVYLKLLELESYSPQPTSRLLNLRSAHENNVEQILKHFQIEENRIRADQYFKSVNDKNSLIRLFEKRLLQDGIAPCVSIQINSFEWWVQPKPETLNNRSSKNAPRIKCLRRILARTSCSTDTQ